MSHLLTWKPGKKADREALEAFTCTVKGEKVRRATGWRFVHPAPWERFVQAKIHTMSPPYVAPEFLLLGWNDEGIGAALFYEELDGPGQVEMHLGAVAMHYRHRGGGWADEMLTTAFDAITTRALESGTDLVEASTWIHEENRASQSMARRFGMRQVGLNEPENLQRWSATVLVSGADLPGS